MLSINEILDDVIEEIGINRDVPDEYIGPLEKLNQIFEDYGIQSGNDLKTLLENRGIEKPQ